MESAGKWTLIADRRALRAREHEVITHTPGPWLVDEDCAWWIGAAGHRVAEAFGGAECNANAKLIAAAPDLLAALQHFAAQSVSDDAQCHVGICTPAECGRCGAILQARAAIAKAEGV